MVVKFPPKNLHDSPLFIFTQSKYNFNAILIVTVYHTIAGCLQFTGGGMHEPIVPTEALYSVAMAVGTSLDLEKTLCTALQAIVRAFDCTAGMVMLAEWQRDRLVSLSTECVIPAESAALRSCRQAAKHAESLLRGQTKRSLALLSPQQTQLSAATTAYIFPLPQYGVLILGKRDVLLTPEQISALDPILHKLEQAIDHALRFRQIQQELADLQYQQQATTAMVDDFLTAVSHELRTPLTLIMGFIETLLDGRPGPLTDTQQRFLQNSYHSSAQMLDLVDNLLMVIHFRQGRVKLDKHPLHPAHLLDELTAGITELANAKQVSLTIDNKWNVDRLCQGDRHWLEKVVLQLADNAIKFTPSNQPVRIESYFQNGQWVFRVTDSGSGIPESELPYVFDRFYRGRNAKADQTHGVGVGLCMCKNIIEAHDGNIGIKNNPEGGVTAWFALPVAETT